MRWKEYWARQRGQQRLETVVEEEGGEEEEEDETTRYEDRVFKDTEIKTNLPRNHSVPAALSACTLRDGNYLIFKDAPKIETIKAGLKYIDINVLRRFSAILHCNGISSHFNIRRSLSSDSYINKSTAKHFTNLGRETFVYLLSPNLSISQST